MPLLKPLFNGAFTLTLFLIFVFSSFIFCVLYLFQLANSPLWITCLTCHLSCFFFFLKISYRFFNDFVIVLFLPYEIYFFISFDIKYSCSFRLFSDLRIWLFICHSYSLLLCACFCFCCCCLLACCCCF